MLIICHVATVLGDQAAILRGIINPGTEQSLTTEADHTLPLDTHQYISRCKYSLPTVASGIDAALSNLKFDYSAPKSEMLPECGPMVDILISHFPYPQFWPRDPSLA